MRAQLKEVKNGVYVWDPTEINDAQEKEVVVFFSQPSDNDEKQKYFKTKACILRVGGEC
jgi:hypothetical protein